MKKMSSTKMKLFRNDVLRHAEKQYGSQPEYLWFSLPNYAVLRHKDNRKWYALFMDVPKEKLGLAGQGVVDVLELKCDPMLAGSMQMEPGILPAYHMHRENWITVFLDGTVEYEKVLFLLDQSYQLTASRREKARQSGNQSWIFPANPGYFDLERAFQESETIFWKQRSQVEVGDTIFLYVAAPVSAIRYQCRVVEVDIPHAFHGSAASMNRVMRIQLQRRFPNGQLPLSLLKEFGVTTVRGPRYMPENLLHEIEAVK